MFEILSPTELNWNKKKEIYQRIEVKKELRKIGVICLITMFTARIIVKMSKMAQFLIFLLMTAEKITTVWAKYLNASERS